MTLSKFNIPKRADDKIAQAGYWKTVEDELGQVWGKFLIRLHDLTFKSCRATADAYNKRHANEKHELKGEALERYTSARYFVECVLLDWEMEGSDGKPIPFTTENAIEYFSDEETKYATVILTAEATNVLNFQPADQKQLPEKN